MRYHLFFIFILPVIHHIFAIKLIALTLNLKHFFSEAIDIKMGLGDWILH